MEDSIPKHETENETSSRRYLLQIYPTRSMAETGPPTISGMIGAGLTISLSVSDVGPSSFAGEERGIVSAQVFESDPSEKAVSESKLDRPSSYLLP